MRPLPKPVEFSVFMDATELHGGQTYLSNLPDVDRSLVWLWYYVSKLTITELSAQLAAEYQSFSEIGESKFSKHFKSACPPPSQEHFAAEILSELAKLPNVRVFDPPDHGDPERALLFNARHRGAYKDAVVFATAVAYARTNNLPRCYFVTQDRKEKDFVELQRCLAHSYQVTIISRDQLKEMLRFNTKMYDDLIAQLQPVMENQATLLRRELVRRGLKNPEILHASPEAMQIFEDTAGGISDLLPIETEVRNLAVRRADEGHSRVPGTVTCRMVVRYSIPGRWARLYHAEASATTRCSQDGALVGIELRDFSLDWMPHG